MTLREHPDVFASCPNEQHYLALHDFGLARRDRSFTKRSFELLIDHEKWSQLPEDGIERYLVNTTMTNVEGRTSADTSGKH